MSLLQHHKPKRKRWGNSISTNEWVLISWITNPKSSTGMKRMDKQICSGSSYSNLTLGGNGAAKEDPDTTPSPNKSF
jgi:hypothetical protein